MKLVSIKNETSFDVFEKLDIRLGTIESVEDVESADRLMCLKVNFGDHLCNIVAGIKQERENPK